jgi:hypothetical protein
MKNFEQRRSERIPGFNKLTLTERAAVLVEWCIEHGKPSRKRERATEWKLAEWLAGLSAVKKRHLLYHAAFDRMKVFDWWTEWLEGLNREKIEIIPGFDQWAREEKATYLLSWCLENGRKKPKQGSADDVERKLAVWLSGLSVTGKRHMLYDVMFDGMNQFGLDKTFKSKVVVLPDFDKMTVEKKVEFLIKWCEDSGGSKPNTRKGSDAISQKLARWMSKMAHPTRRQHLRSLTFQGMERFAWWDEWVEQQYKTKEERIPGWGTWSLERKAMYLIAWCTEHRRRPVNHSKDPAENKLAEWLRGLSELRKQSPPFDGMKKFPWWVKK